MNTLTGRLSRSLPARSSLRAFSLTPSRAFVPTQAVRAGHGKHPVPPEGDIDHGRSGWGFQSHSRHEHFTFPGEDPDPYETNETFNTPFFWSVGILSVGTYVFWDSIPGPPKTQFTPGSYGRPVYDSYEKLGPDDDRTLYNRLRDYLLPSPDQAHEELVVAVELARVNAEISRTRQTDPLLQSQNYEKIDRNRRNTGAITPDWGNPGEVRDMQNFEAKGEWHDKVKYIPDYYKNMEKTNPTIAKNFKGPVETGKEDLY